MTGATLFSGGDLAGIGMMQAGVNLRWGIEINDDIASVAHANGHPVITQDILRADPTEYERVDYLHASPPCPSFSVAKTGGEETDIDRALAAKVCAFIRVLRSRIFTLENVWGYRTSQSWDRIQLCLQAEGYAWNAWKLNSADYGVPQNRERMIVAARLEGRRPVKPTPTHAKNPPAPGLFGDALNRWNGWYAAVEDLLPSCPESRLADWQLRRMPDEIKTLLVGAGGFRGKVVQAGPHEPAFTVTANRNQQNQIRSVLVEAKEGPIYVHGSAPCLAVSRSTQPRAVLIDGKLNEGERITCIDGERRAFTVTTSHNNRDVKAVAGIRVVQLMPRCLARFQTLPDAYILPEKRSLACTIIGNGVPCLLMRRLYESLQP